MLHLLQNKVVKMTGIASGLLLFWLFSPYIIIFDNVPFYSVYARLIFLFILLLSITFLIKKKGTLFFQKLFLLFKKRRELFEFFILQGEVYTQFYEIKHQLQKYNKENNNALDRLEWCVVFSDSPTQSETELYHLCDNIKLKIQEHFVWVDVNYINSSVQQRLLLKKIISFFRKNRAPFLISTSLDHIISKNNSTFENEINNLVHSTKKNQPLYLLINDIQRIPGMDAYLHYCKELNISPKLFIPSLNEHAFSNFINELSSKITFILSKVTLDSDKTALVYLEHQFHRLKEILFKNSNLLKIKNFEGVFFSSSDQNKNEVDFFQNENHFTDAGNQSERIDVLTLDTLLSDFFTHHPRNNRAARAKSPFILFSLFSLLMTLSCYVTIEQINQFSSDFSSYGVANTTNENQSMMFLESSYQANKKLFSSFSTFFFDSQIIYPLYLHHQFDRFIQFNLEHHFSSLLEKFIKYASTDKGNANETHYSLIKSIYLLENKNHLSEQAISNFILHYNNDYPDAVQFYSKLFISRHNELIHYTLTPESKKSLFNLSQDDLLILELKDNLSSKNEFFYKKIISFCDVFNCDNKPRISFLFTRNGYLQLLKHDLFIYQKTLSSLLPEKKFPNKTHPTKFTHFWDNYDDLYIQSWEQSFSNLKLKKCDSLKSMINLLKCIRAKKSPFVSLLDLLRDNTYPLIGDRKKIAAHYQMVNEFIGYPGKPSKEFKLLEADLTDLINILSRIQASPYPEKSEFEEMRTLFSENEKENKFLKLISDSKQMPSFIQIWVNQLISNILDVMLADSLKYIQTQWEKDVYTYYLKDIKSHSTLTDTTESMNAFFGPEGIYLKFIENNFKPFFNIEHTPWLWKEVLQHHLPVSTSSITQLANTYHFSKIFFSHSPLTLHITPRYLDPKVKSVFVYIGEENLVYRHGPQISSSFSWPIDPKQIRIEFLDFHNEEHALQYEGEGALMKLLSSSHCREQNGHLSCNITIDNFKFSYEVNLGSGNANLGSAKINLPEML